MTDKYEGEDWDVILKLVVPKIESGTFDNGEAYREYMEYYGIHSCAVLHPSAETCAFAQ